MTSFMQFYQDRTNTTQSTVEFSEIANSVLHDILGMAHQIRVYHLITDSHKLHLALEELYETIEDKSDKILEKLIGLGATLKENKSPWVVETHIMNMERVCNALCNVVKINIAKTSAVELAAVNGNLIDILDKIQSVRYFMK